MTSLRTSCGAAHLAALPNEAVAQNILLADKREIAGLETLFDAEDRKRRLARLQRQSLGQARDGMRRFQPVLAEHRAEPLGRTVRPAGDDDAPAACLQRADMADGGLEDIGILVGALGGEIASRPAAAIDDQAASLLRRGKRREARDGGAVEAPAPFFRRDIEPFGRQRLIGGMGRIGIVLRLAGVVIILDLRQALARRVVGERIEQRAALRRHSRRACRARRKTAAANVRARGGGGLRSPLHRACRRASAHRTGRHRPGGSGGSSPS